ncbi:MAG: hypothetical protein WA975_04980 [Mesorhizobium sp.]
MTDAILDAARWLSTTPQRQRPHPIIPHLQKTYGLSAKEACDAIRKAHEIAARAH